MPLYEFRCNRCDHVFERLCRMGEGGKQLECPQCGARGVRRIMSVFSARVEGKAPSGALSGASCSTCRGGSCATCR